MNISRLRLNGFSSGMDIDDMVKKLMAANRIPMEKLKQKKQTMEWQREEYRDMNKLILDLRNKSLDMKLQGTYGSKKAASTGTYFSVSATNNATEGQFSLKVNTLAKAAELTSGDVVTAGTGTGAMTLADLGLSGETTITISGSQGTATIAVKQTDSLDLLVRNVNAKSTYTGVKLSYDASLDRLFFTTTKTGADSSFTIKSANPNLLDTVLKFTSSNGSTTANKLTGSKAFTEGLQNKIDSTLTAEQTLRFTYNNVNYDYKINKDTTVEQLINMVNGSAAGKAGVSAYLDENNKLAFMLPDKTKPYSFSDQTSDASNIVDALGLTAVTPADVTYKQIGASGTNAKVTFNGAPGEFASNTFSINGLNFTLKDVMTGDPEQVTVSQDVDGVFDKIKSYIDLYNETIDKINKKISETRYRDFVPLTDEQKADMSDKEIERWEERAKSGLIRRDQVLDAALNQFRTAFSNVVTGLPSGEHSMLSQIGISTLDYSEKGKLHIDETKLKKAITDNPDQVMRLFTIDDNNTDSRSGDGIANRIYQVADIFRKQIVEKAGTESSTVLDSYSIGKGIKDIDDRIERMNRRLSDMEERYYKQFTAMESALNRMNAQSSYLAQQFGGAQ